MSAQPRTSKYYTVRQDDQEFKVKRCEEPNCGREIFFDGEIQKFIDLEYRNNEKNWHWNYCPRNPAFKGLPGQQQQQQPKSYYGSPNPSGYTGSSADYVNKNTTTTTTINADLQTSLQQEIEYLRTEILEIKMLMQALHQAVTNYIRDDPVMRSLSQFTNDMIDRNIKRGDSFPRPKTAADLVKKELIDTDEDIYNDNEPLDPNDEHRLNEGF